MFLLGKRSIEPACAAMLTAMADDNASLDIEHVDANGRVAATGRSRVFQFDPTAGEVVVEIPTKEGRPIPIGEGDTVRVFAVVGGGVYRFASVVIGKNLVPSRRGNTPVLRLEVPNALENANRRSHFRIAPLASHPVEAAWRLGSTDVKAVNTRPWNTSRVFDISGRGIGLWIDAKFADVIHVGRHLELQLELTRPAGVTSLRTRAIVRRTRPPIDVARPIFAGVEFQVAGRGKDRCLEPIVAYVTWCQLELARLQREKL